MTRTPAHPLGAHARRLQERRDATEIEVLCAYVSHHRAVGYWPTVAMVAVRVGLSVRALQPHVARLLARRQLTRRARQAAAVTPLGQRRLHLTHALASEVAP